MRVITALILASLLATPVAAQDASTDPAADPVAEPVAPVEAPAEPITLTIDEIIAVLREVEDEDTFTAMAAGFAIPEDQRPLYAAHFRAIFDDNAVAADFATSFATEQGQFPVLSHEEMAVIARNLAAGWSHEIAVLGTARLEDEDRRALLQASLDQLDHMPVDICAANTRGALDPVEVLRAEVAYLATLEATEVEVHLARTRRAITAEIADDPPYRPLSESETQKAGEAYQTAFVEGIDAHPMKPLVLEAVENFDLAPDAAICELTKISLTAALSIEGETGELVLRLLTSG